MKHQRARLLEDICCGASVNSRPGGQSQCAVGVRELALRRGLRQRQGGKAPGRGSRYPSVAAAGQLHRAKTLESFKRHPTRACTRARGAESQYTACGPAPNVTLYERLEPRGCEAPAIRLLDKTTISTIEAIYTATRAAVRALRVMMPIEIPLMMANYQVALRERSCYEGAPS